MQDNQRLINIGHHLHIITGLHLHIVTGHHLHIEVLYLLKSLILGLLNNLIFVLHNNRLRSKIRLLINNQVMQDNRIMRGTHLHTEYLTLLMQDNRIVQGIHLHTEYLTLLMQDNLQYPIQGVRSLIEYRILQMLDNLLFLRIRSHIVTGHHLHTTSLMVAVVKTSVSHKPMKNMTRNNIKLTGVLKCL